MAFIELEAGAAGVTFDDMSPGRVLVEEFQLVHSRSDGAWRST